jgi:MFS family permease
MNGPLQESWRAWLALLVGVFAITAHTASSYTLSILMKPMLEEFGWNRTLFASAMTLRMFVMVLAISFAGQMTDRFGARVVLAGGALLVGAGTFATAAMTAPAQFYPIMALMGPGQACIGSVAASALVLRLFRKRRGVAIGILNGGDNLISSTIPIAAAFLLVRSGWRATIGSLGILYVALAVLILLVLRAQDGRSDAGPSSTSVRSAMARVRMRDLPWSDWRLWAVCISYAGIYAFITSLQLHFHAFQTDMGRTPAEASALMSTLILVGAVGSPLFGWIAERTSALTALVIVVVGLTAASFVLWTPHSNAAYAGWAIGYGLVNSGVVAVLALVLNELFGEQQIGRLLGVAMVFCMGATMIANIYTASMFDYFGSYFSVWRSYSAVMLAALVPVLWLRWNAGPRRRAQNG